MDPGVGVTQRPVVGRGPSAVVRVDTPSGVLVEALDRGEALGIDAAEPGQVVERPGLLQPAALEHLAREPTGAGPQVGVPLAVAVVEDQPAGHGPARPCPLVHRLADLHVRVGPRSRSAARRRRRRSCGAAGGPGRGSTARSGPCGVTAATRLRPSGRSGLRGPWRPPGPRRCRPGWRSTTGPSSAGHPVPLTHLGVVGETAGGQQDALPGADHDRRAVAHRPHPDHAARPAPPARRRGPRSRTGCPPPARSSNWAMSEAPLVNKVLTPYPGGGGAACPGRDGERPDAAVVVPRSRTVRLHGQPDALGQAGLELGQPGPQGVAVVGHRLDAPPDVVAARGVGVVVAP